MPKNMINRETEKGSPGAKGVNHEKERYQRSLNDDTALVSLMWANNETGVLFPVEEVAAIAHAKGIPFHTDAVQAVGRVQINLRNSAIDMLSISGHKFHGPKGIGIIYLRHHDPSREAPLLEKRSSGNIDPL
jgi:cysteine desulfurase